MGNVFKKLSNCVNNVFQKVKPMIGQIKQPIIGIVVGFLLVVLLLILTFYAAWCFMWYQGKALLGDLRSLIDIVTSAQVVAFIAFIATSLIDKDNNGIPDKFENEVKDKK